MQPRQSHEYLLSLDFDLDPEVIGHDGEVVHLQGL